jgi:p-cumate 2,3-dioxygenase beta subunit
MLTRAESEDFLYHEAYLLDEWQLVEWSELFTPDGEYLIPPIDNPKAEAGKDLFLVYDDRHRLGERAKRLLKKQAHAEFPHSVLRRIVSNVIVHGVKDEVATVSCNYVLYRSRKEESEVFPGHSIYELVRAGGGQLSIKRKRAVIASDSLREQGRVSIIL